MAILPRLGRTTARKATEGSDGHTAHASGLSFSGGGRVRPLTIWRSAQARAMRLSVDPRDGTVRLTLPRRAALAHALAWAEQQRGWIEQALTTLPPALAIGPDAMIPLEGALVRVIWRLEAPRAVSRSGDTLIVGGPAESVGPRVLRWLRREALARLDTETRALGARAGITIGRIGVGDPRARWGSCSADGDIRYSWRLILAPPEVREATIAHEVAHRLHMDHSPAFHAAVARLLGRDPGPERRWLRRHGPALHWLGRDR